MIYPSVKTNDNTHAVKDEYLTICGLVYRKTLPNQSKQFFKPIKFKNIESIDCEKCKEIILSKAT